MYHEGPHKEKVVGLGHSYDDSIVFLKSVITWHWMVLFFFFLSFFLFFLVEDHKCKIENDEENMFGMRPMENIFQEIYGVAAFKNVKSRFLFF